MMWEGRSLKRGSHNRDDLYRAEYRSPEIMPAENQNLVHILELFYRTQSRLNVQ